MSPSPQRRMVEPAQAIIPRVKCRSLDIREPSAIHQLRMSLSYLIRQPFPLRCLSSCSSPPPSFHLWTLVASDPMAPELTSVLVSLLPFLFLVWRTGAGGLDVDHLLFGEVFEVSSPGSTPPLRVGEANWSWSSSPMGGDEEWKDDILQLARRPEVVEWLKGLRRRIHEHPELAYEEVETGRLIKKELDAMGVDYRFPFAMTGIVATIGSGELPISSAQKRQKSSQTLLQIRRGQNKFQKEKLELQDLEPAVAHATLAHILKEGPFNYALGLQQPNTLAKLLELTNNYISNEEYSSTYASARTKVATVRLKRRALRDNRWRPREELDPSTRSMYEGNCPLQENRGGDSYNNRGSQSRYPNQRSASYHE
ncbi:uncharacterized protein LOC110026968 [Phalaenopsis equestris]|uniref:uncharacterized protein LOC110026968 n=1 Tax=Phalaenopsis equestris TaxID=78828 RepID=UPI0009E3B9CB|nr:uncharacterized protein LOC110026968 [Phalaenopsis equestris]